MLKTRIHQINYLMMKTLLILAIISANSCTLQGNKNSEILQSDTKNLVEQETSDKKNEYEKISVNSETSRTINCGQFTYEIRNSLIKVYSNDNKLSEFSAAKIFYDKNSLKLIFSLKNENRLVFFKLM